MYRRKAVASVGSLALTVLAGCSVVESLISGGGGPLPDLYFFNRTSDTRRIAFEATHEGETVLQDTLELEADESASYDNPFTEAGTYSITVSTDDGLEGSYTWDELSENPDGDPDGLHIRIEDETITFEEVIA